MRIRSGATRTCSPAYAGRSPRLGCIAGVFWYSARNIDHVVGAAIRDYRPPLVTRTVARDGTVLGEIFSELIAR